MKYLNEFADYLHKEGYEDKYYGSADVDFYDKFNNKITIFVEATEEFENFLRENPNAEFEINFSNYIVHTICFYGTISTEPNYYVGSEISCITLVKDKGYHTHGLELFEKCVQLQKSNLVEHELFILQKHIKHLKWVNEVLIPILNKADYYTKYSSIFDLSDHRTNSNLVIEFQHYNDGEYDISFFIETDCITGDFIVTDNLPIYGKSKEEVWNILIEDYWKKFELPIRKRYSYLYTENETKDTYKQYINKLLEK